jgi:hypothetical protein
MKTIYEQELWGKICSFKLDDEGSSLQFSRRLARENKWTHTFAKRVAEEYKKFIFLCCITQSGVTPSDQVDQAWHLHLTYTKSYWIELCKNILKKEIHHNPTKGGAAEGEKFDGFYSETRRLYSEKFSCSPPADIWPENEVRFSDIDFQRINTKKYWLIQKPRLGKSQITLLVIFLASVFCIQASNLAGFGTAMFVLALVYFIAKAIGGGGGTGGGSSSGGSGCSLSGCGSSGHSGCSGCSGSGCSGCGGGCS